MPLGRVPIVTRHVSAILSALSGIALPSADGESVVLSPLAVPIKVRALRLCLSGAVIALSAELTPDRKRLRL